MLWDCIFGETQLQVAKGSIGLHASTLACFSIASQNNASLKQVTEEGSCELSHKIRQQMHDITPSQMQHHLSQVDAWLQTVQDLSQREEACKKAKSAQWSIGRKLEWDLANGHHFTVDELKEIKAAYKDLVGAKDTGLSFVQLTVLLDRLPCPPPPEFTARVFQVYDTDTSRRIDLKQLVCCMSCLYRGSYQERLRLCFDVFDRDRSGFLSLPEVEGMAECIAQMSESGSVNLKSAWYKRMMEMDTNEDGQVSFEEFYAGAYDDKDLRKAIGFGLPTIDSSDGDKPSADVSLSASDNGRLTDVTSASSSFGHRKSSGTPVSEIFGTPQTSQKSVGSTRLHLDQNAECCACIAM